MVGYSGHFRWCGGHKAFAGAEKNERLGLPVETRVLGSPLAGFSGGSHAGIADDEAPAVVVALQMDGKLMVYGCFDLLQVVFFGGVVQGMGTAIVALAMEG